MDEQFWKSASMSFVVENNIQLKSAFSVLPMDKRSKRKGSFVTENETRVRNKSINIFSTLQDITQRQNWVQSLNCNEWTFCPQDILNRLTDEEMKCFYEAFKEFDYNNDGHINTKELSKWGKFKDYQCLESLLRVESTH